MKDLSPVIARIIVRYCSGALVSYGLIAPETAEYAMVDPDLALIVGLAAGFIAETFYVFAVKHGWTK